MAKELPYFKFEPNEWENGNIQIFSHEIKGIFIDLCSIYWSRLGDLPYKLAVQKICGGNATALDSLCEENIIENIDGNIFIKFLSEQLNDFDNLSKKNSKNAIDGWLKRRESNTLSDRNATALDSQCDRNAIREDKIREDEIKKEDIKEKKIKKKKTLKKDDVEVKIEYEIEGEHKNVKLKKEEKEKLINKHGAQGYSWIIEKLSNYKLSFNKKYASDYGAINSWVAKEYEKEREKTRINQKPQPFKSLGI